MEFDIWEPPGAGRSQENSHSLRVERVKFLGVEWELPGKEGRAEGRTGTSKEKKLLGMSSQRARGIRVVGGVNIQIWDSRGNSTS